MVARHMFVFPKSISLPSGWNKRRFGDIASIQSGYGFPLRFQGRSDGSYPFYKVADISKAAERSEIHLHKANHYITDSDCRKLNAAPFPSGSTVFAKIGAAVLLNRRAMLSQDSLVDNNVMVITPNCNLLNNQYAYYTLLTIDMADYVNMTAVPSIRRSDVADTLLYVPPIPEQCRIAEVLDTADRTITQTERLIEKLRAIKSGLLHDLLTRGIGEDGRVRDPERNPEKFRDSDFGLIPTHWEVCTLDEKLNRVIDYRGKTPVRSDAGIPLITAKNVRDGYLDWEPREYVTETIYQEWMTRGIPSQDDILFTTEAPLGFVARAPEARFALAQRILTLCPNKTVLDSSFLLWLMQWPTVRKLILQKSTGTTVFGIKQPVLRQMEFPFPELDEQKLIGLNLDSCHQRIRNELGYLEKLRMIKNGLMRDLLTGRVRVEIPIEKGVS